MGPAPLVRGETNVTLLLHCCVRRPNTRLIPLCRLRVIPNMCL